MAKVEGLRGSDRLGSGIVPSVFCGELTSQAVASMERAASRPCASDSG